MVSGSGDEELLLGAPTIAYAFAIPCEQLQLNQRRRMPNCVGALWVEVSALNKFVNKGDLMQRGGVQGSLGACQS